MSKVSRTLNGKDEVLGCRRIPVRKALRHLHAVKSAVDLKRIELAGGIVEFAFLWQPRRVEIASPRGIGPTGDADANVATFDHDKVTVRLYQGSELRV